MEAGDINMKSVSDWSYEELLDRALSMVPQKTIRGERFKIPSAVITIVGNKTILHNFKDICEVLNRDVKHVAKFILREIGTAGDIEDTRLILQGRFSRASINNVIERYAKYFIICPVCNAPDTYLTKERRVYILVCTACGARTSVSIRWF